MRFPPDLPGAMYPRDEPEELSLNISNNLFPSDTHTLIVFLTRRRLKKLEKIESRDVALGRTMIIVRSRPNRRRAPRPASCRR